MSATSGQLESRPYQPPSVQERAAAVFRSVPSEEDLKALVKNSATIITITNQAGYDQCHSARMALKNTRLEIERTGEEGRDDAVQTSKAIIAIQKSRISITKAEEDRLAAIQKAWDDRVAREKEEKIQADIKRVEIIQARIEEIRATAIHSTTLDSLMLGQVLSRADSMTIDPVIFQEFTPKAQEALTVTRAALAGLLAKRKEQDQKERELEEQRQEYAKLKAAEVQRQRVAAEVQARADAEAQAARDAEAARQAEENRLERERIAKEEADARAVRLAEARAHAEEIRLQRIENERLAAERQKELDAQKEANDAQEEERRHAAAQETGRIAAARQQLERDQEAARKAAEPKQSKSEQKRVAAMKGYPTRAELLDGVAAYFKTDADTARGWLSFYDWKVDERKSA